MTATSNVLRMAANIAKASREREVFRYWQPSTDNELDLAAPRSSIDTALTAFAQLGALRLKAQRCIISLVGKDTEFVLAEATQSLSLQDDTRHDLDDQLWHGAGGMKGRAGFGIILMDLLMNNSLNPVPYVTVDDLSQDNRFNSLEMVTGPPFVRSLTCLPLRTPDGYVIGLYLVVDVKPRESSLSPSDIQFLTDMASTTMNHLEASRSKQRYHRAEKMVKALGLYLEGGESLRDWWLNLASEGRSVQQSGLDEGLRRGATLELYADSQFGVQDPADQIYNGIMTRLPDEPNPQLQSLEPLDIFPQGSSRPKPFDMISVDSSVGSAAMPKHPAKEPSNFSESDSKFTQFTSQGTTATNLEPRPAESNFVRRQSDLDADNFSGKALQDALLSSDVMKSFSRASNLIRESTDVDGVAFFDASIGSFGTRSTKDAANQKAPGVLNKDFFQETTTSSSDINTYESRKAGETSFGNEREFSASQTANDTARLMGFSTRTRSSNKSHLDSRQLSRFPESFVRKLAKRYPHGKIFNFDEDGILSLSDIETDKSDGQVVSEAKSRKKKLRDTRNAEARAIQAIIPGAKSVAWFPIWDSASERWYAGTLLWVFGFTRILSPEEDLTYLAVWSNSIMAEVSRISALVTSRVKVDFVSSISHELRSPLHGILASVEFLKEDYEHPEIRNDMINTIDSCGKTLLDTINHVLEFSKINKRRKPKTSRRRTGRHYEESSEDRKDRSKFTTSNNLWLLTEEVVDSVYAGRNMIESQEPGIANPVIVVQDIAWKSNWNFDINAGAFRRILMNLFSNALKYTKNGYVKVGLTVNPVPTTTGSKFHHMLYLTVSDSGKGISRDFLRDHLYTAFRQEDALSSGTGLGLSIVRQLLSEVNGRIEIKSEVGSGSQAFVTIPLKDPNNVPRFNSSTNDVSEVRSVVKGLSICFLSQGFNIYPNISDTPTGILSGEAEGLILLRNSLASTIIQWFEMVEVDDTEQGFASADVLIAMGSDDILDVLKDLGSLTSKPFKCSAVIALCDGSYRRQDFTTSSGIKIFHLRMPASPHKVAYILRQAFCSEQNVGSTTASGFQTSSHPIREKSGTSNPPPAQGVIPAVKASTIRPFIGRRKSGIVRVPPILPTEDSIEGSPIPVSRRHDQCKALLVEDNQINLKLICAYMVKLKHDYTPATNGQEALDAYKAAGGKFDIVFMDLQMPVMGGLEASRQIRNHEQQNGLPPKAIVALTGAASMSAQHEAFSSGIDLFLTKPVQMTVLNDIIVKLRTNGRSALREYT